MNTLNRNRLLTLLCGAAAVLPFAFCGEADEEPEEIAALLVGRDSLTIYAGPADTTVPVYRLSLRSSLSDTLRRVDSLQIAIEYGPGAVDWLSVALDTLSSGALVLAHTYTGTQLDTGMYYATVTLSSHDFPDVTCTVRLIVQPFVLRLVLPPIAGHTEEDVDAVTQASDVIPQLAFIVDPPRLADSLDYVLVRTSDIDSTIYDTRMPGKQVLPYFYGRKIPVTHWYVKRPETSGICTTYAYAFTRGGLSATDMLVVRVLDKTER
jgi:hypothetical protein